MILECNNPKLCLINLDNVDGGFDDIFFELANFIDCIFIVSDDERRKRLEKNIKNSVFVKPNIWFQLTSGNFLKQLLQENEIQPYEAVYITGNAHEENNGLGISIILLLSSNEVGLDKNNLPDHFVYNIPTIIQRLKGEGYGYFGELFADGSSGYGGYADFVEKNSLLPGVEADLIVFGRYFTSTDTRAYIHPLTQLILQMKNGNKNQMKSAAQLLASSVNFFAKNGNTFDYLTNVPPKPGKQNILMRVIKESQDLENEPLDARIKVRELLTVSESYRPQKEVGNYSNRFSNVKDKFDINNKVKGHVAILDDIITSGATALECAKMLYKAGADKVTIIGFGASQAKVQRTNTTHLCCNMCEDGEYKIRFNSRDHSAFFGCTNWPECRSNLKFNVGRKAYNQQNVIVHPETEDEPF